MNGFPLRRRQMPRRPIRLSASRSFPLNHPPLGIGSAWPVLPRIAVGSSCASGPPFDAGANASQKLCCVDWFRYVVICPQVEHENPVCRLTRTQDKKWNILRCLSNLATEILDRLARKPYIQDNKIGLSWREYSRY